MLNLYYKLAYLSGRCCWRRRGREIVEVRNLPFGQRVQPTPGNSKIYNIKIHVCFGILPFESLATIDKRLPHLLIFKGINPHPFLCYDKTNDFVWMVRILF